MKTITALRWEPETQTVRTVSNYCVAELGRLETMPDVNVYGPLIAAAPELLRELQSAIFYIKTYGGEVTENFAAGGNLEAVERILAKARGEL